MNFINFTPHVINVKVNHYDAASILAIPSIGIARVAVKEREEGIAIIQKLPMLDVQLFSESFGEVEGLPDPQENTLYIVSCMVADALPPRQ